MNLGVKKFKNLLPMLLGWLAVVFAFLLPLQTRLIVKEEVIRGGIWEYGRVSIYGFDIALFVIALLILIGILLGRKRILIKLQRSHILLIIFALIFFSFELVASLDWQLTGVVIIRLTLVFIFLWYLRHSNKIVLRRVLAAFVVSMVLSAGFGVAQFATQDSLIESKWLGLAEQRAITQGVSVVETSLGRWLRAYGSMPHPNSLGGFSAIALILFWSLLFSKSKKNFHINLLKKKFFAIRLGEFCRNVFVALTPLILIGGVITAVSRAALLATVLGLAALFWNKRKLLLAKTVRAPLITLVIGLLIVALFSAPVLATRLTADGRLESLSFVKREAAFQGAFTTLKFYGIAGTGFGANTVALQQLYRTSPIWELQPVHNVPLLMITELGIGGLVLLGLFLWQLKKALGARLQATRNTIPLLVCFLILIMLDHYMWTFPSGLYLSGLVLNIFIRKK